MCQLALKAIALVAVLAPALILADRNYELSQELNQIRGFSSLFDLYSRSKRSDYKMEAAKYLVHDVGLWQTDRASFNNLFDLKIESPCFAIGTFHYDNKAFLKSVKEGTEPLSRVNGIAELCSKYIKDSVQDEIYTLAANIINSRG